MIRWDVNIDVFLEGMEFKEQESEENILPTWGEIIKKLKKMPVKNILKDVTIVSIEKKGKKEINKVSYGDKLITDEQTHCCIAMGLIDSKNKLTKEKPLDLSGMKDIVLADIDYFVEHYNYMVSIAKGLIERRDAKKIKEEQDV